MHICKISVKKAQCQSVTDLICCALDLLGLGDLGLSICGGDGKTKDLNPR